MAHPVPGGARVTATRATSCSTPVSRIRQNETGGCSPRHASGSSRARRDRNRFPLRHSDRFGSSARGRRLGQQTPDLRRAECRRRSVERSVSALARRSTSAALQPSRVAANRHDRRKRGTTNIPECFSAHEQASDARRGSTSASSTRIAIPGRRVAEVRREAIHEQAHLERYMSGARVDRLDGEVRGAMV